MIVQHKASGDPLDVHQLRLKMTSASAIIDKDATKVCQGEAAKSPAYRDLVAETTNALDRSTVYDTGAMSASPSSSGTLSPLRDRLNTLDQSKENDMGAMLSSPSSSGSTSPLHDHQDNDNHEKVKEGTDTGRISIVAGHVCIQLPISYHPGCLTCRMNFRSCDALALHIGESHRGLNVVYFCGKCGKTGAKNSITGHTPHCTGNRVPSAPKREAFVCETEGCVRSFSSRMGLSQHLQEV